MEITSNQLNFGKDEKEGNYLKRHKAYQHPEQTCVIFVVRK